MANRNFPQSKQWSNHLMPVSIDAQIAIGATGAPTIASGNGYGVAAITRLAAGQYRVQLQDNYSKLLQFKAYFQSPTSGSSVTAGSFSTGTVYRITALGTTTQAQWETAGVPSGTTAAAGVVFKAAAAGAGNGTAQTLASSGIQTVELLGSSNNMLISAPNGTTVQNFGGYVDFQCMAPTFTAGAYTPAGTVASHTHSFTPAGTVAAGIIPVTTGTAGDAVTNNAGILESTGGQDLTVNSQAFTGDVGTTGATAPTFTGTAASLTGTVTYAAADPANGSQLFIEIIVSNSSIQ